MYINHFSLTFSSVNDDSGQEDATFAEPQAVK